jgi:hypothetical protein
MKKLIFLSTYYVLGLLNTSSALAQVEPPRCAEGTVIRYLDGSTASCVLVVDYAFGIRMFKQNQEPTERLECKAAAVEFYSNPRRLKSCTLNQPLNITVDRVSSTCSAGKVIRLNEQGLLSFPKWCS